MKLKQNLTCFLIIVLGVINVRGQSDNELYSMINRTYEEFIESSKQVYDQVVYKPKPFNETITICENNLPRYFKFSKKIIDANYNYINVYRKFKNKSKAIFLDNLFLNGDKIIIKLVTYRVSRYNGCKLGFAISDWINCTFQYCSQTNTWPLIESKTGGI